MRLIDRIVASPGDWTATEVIDEVAPALYEDGDRRRDPVLPPWLREVLVLCDFDTRLQMEGLLGWWENRASEDLTLVADAFRSVGMDNDARLLEEAASVLLPSQLDAAERFQIGSVSSFAERHPAVTPQQYACMHDLENRLYLNAADGFDLYALLTAHAASGLASSATLNERPVTASGMTGRCCASAEASPTDPCKDAACASRGLKIPK